MPVTYPPSNQEHSATCIAVKPSLVTEIHEWPSQVTSMFDSNLQ